jgi:hypothetical protein
MYISRRHLGELKVTLNVDFKINYNINDIFVK